MLALLGLIVVAAAMSGGGDTTGTTADPSDRNEQSQSTSPDSAAGNAPTSTLPLQDGDWRLDTVTVEESLGTFGGRARITYTGDDSNGGNNIFTITLFVGGKDVGTLQGAANDVSPGRTVTVSLFSTDKYVKGPYKYDFQNDL